MNEAWGAVVAAIAAGVFGLVGAWLGHRAGRRQTTDQATVEHGQWLRGQRQEAYLGLLDAFDETKKRLQTVVDQWDETAREADQQGWADSEFEEEIDSRVQAAVDGLVKPLERAHLLGPQPVELVVDELTAWADQVSIHLHQQATPGTGPWDWSAFPAFMARGSVLRDRLVAATKEALRTPPKPGG